MKPVSSHRRARYSVTLPPWPCGQPSRFTLQVRLRGELGPTCQILCSGLEEAIQFGTAEFPAFAERNPWIGSDWLQRRIWILLDPETESRHSETIFSPALGEGEQRLLRKGPKKANKVSSSPVDPTGARSTCS